MQFENSFLNEDKLIYIFRVSLEQMIDMNRDEGLLKIRLEVDTEVNYEISAAERFQNNTLRPLLKFQNDLLIFLFINTMSISKINFEKKTDFDKKKIIDDTLKKDIKLKDQVESSIIALMISGELSFYHKNRSEMKRRIITMTSERLKDQLVL